jgi:hypothetical protein
MQLFNARVLLRNLKTVVACIDDHVEVEGYPKKLHDRLNRKESHKRCNFKYNRQPRRNSVTDNKYCDKISHVGLLTLVAGYQLRMFTDH